VFNGVINCFLHQRKDGRFYLAILAGNIPAGVIGVNFQDSLVLSPTSF
jgi:undecaprenyl pyrophosphate phosphatase UppP